MGQRGGTAWLTAMVFCCCLGAGATSANGSGPRARIILPAAFRGAGGPQLIDAQFGNGTETILGGALVGASHAGSLNSVGLSGGGSALGPHDLGAVSCWANTAYEAACEARQCDAPRCVDDYYRAAALCWYVVTHDPCGFGGSALGSAALSRYHESVRGLAETGQQYGRLRASSGLRVVTPQGAIMVPVEHHGFVWQADDFEHLLSARDYDTSDLTQVHCRSGVGVPVVVARRRRCREAAATHFLGEKSAFAATMLLIPDATPFLPADACSANNSCGDAKLLFLDPLRVCHARAAGVTLRVAADLSAPLAFLASNPDLQQMAVMGLLRPESEIAGGGLRTLEPIQSGKIPLVFVHGLLSDPSTWLGLANELRAHPAFSARYQIWAFRYPTGRPFLRSAAALRRQLDEVLCLSDPEGVDEMLRQIVIVGHSMGGLIAKLQAAHSSDILWRHAAYVPLECIRADAQSKAELSEMFYFEPHPAVKRVIFVATPHRGSPWANRPIGLLGSALVQRSPEDIERYDRIVDANPGAFWPYAERRIPTSIDILRAGHPLLEAIGKLPMSPCVKTHSIIGTGKWMLMGGRGDGAVTVKSAVHAGVCSERFVPSRHMGIQSHSETVCEMYRILGMSSGS